MSFRLERQQLVRRGIEEVFAFFSDPTNLEAITPPWLNFRVLETPAGPLRELSEISYRLRVRGIPFSWRSLISRWEPPFVFVDEQLEGPYQSWIHRHTFEVQNGSTLVRDRVDYSVPGGAIVNSLFVRHDLKKIFDYREESLRTALESVERGQV